MRVIKFPPPPFQHPFTSWIPLIAALCRSNLHTAIFHPTSLLPLPSHPPPPQPTPLFLLRVSGINFSGWLILGWSTRGQAGIMRVTLALHRMRIIGGRGGVGGNTNYLFSPFKEFHFFRKLTDPAIAALKNMLYLFVEKPLYRTLANLVT